MAVYAPKTSTGTGGHEKVASLVLPNPPTATAALTALDIDGSSYRVKPAINGVDGQVPYLGRAAALADGYLPETIFRQDVYVCEDENDFETSKAGGMSMSQVFESWQKGGQWNGKSYGYDSDYYTQNSGDIKNPPGFAEWFRYNAERG